MVKMPRIPHHAVRKLTFAGCNGVPAGVVRRSNVERYKKTQAIKSLPSQRTQACQKRSHAAAVCSLSGRPHVTPACQEAEMPVCPGLMSWHPARQSNALCRGVAPAWECLLRPLSQVRPQPECSFSPRIQAPKVKEISAIDAERLPAVHLATIRKALPMTKPKIAPPGTANNRGQSLCAIDAFRTSPLIALSQIAEARLRHLEGSPSRISNVLRGSGKRFRTALTAEASGGDRIAPSVKAEA